jgi:cephalosporin-C deacetylase-like acetyl esterase
MPETILQQTRAEVRRPVDFIDYWIRVKAELALVPVEWERLPGVGGETETHSVDWVRFSSLGDLVIYGWLTVLKVLPTGGCRGYLWLLMEISDEWQAGKAYLTFCQ